MYQPMAIAANTSMVTTTARDRHLRFNRFTPLHSKVMQESLEAFHAAVSGSLGHSPPSRSGDRWQLTGREIGDGSERCCGGVHAPFCQARPLNDDFGSSLASRRSRSRHEVLSAHRANSDEYHLSESSRGQN